MATALYRKYRPQKFSDVTGQEPIVETLQSEIVHEDVSHAYCFSGPRGVGKTTLARLLAKAVNCQKRKEKSSEPCNTCDTCRAMNEGRLLDIVEIDAASHTGVDHVRDVIIEQSRIAPFAAKWKVFIIDEAHMLSNPAFNALLKTLEEPPPNVMFIMATTAVEKVPVTVLSRCERYAFKTLAGKVIRKRLEYIAKEEGKEVEPQVMDAIVRASGGSVRDGESLMGQLFSFSGKKVTKEDADLVIPPRDLVAALLWAEHVLRGRTKEAIELVEAVADNGADCEQFLDDIIEMGRVLLLEKIGVRDAVVFDGFSEKDQATITELAKDTALPAINRFIDVLLARKLAMGYAVVPQLPIEMAAAELAGEGSGESSTG